MSLLIERVECFPEILAKGLDSIGNVQGEVGVGDFKCLEQTLERREKR
jgi:hypothetical protein